MPKAISMRFWLAFLAAHGIVYDRTESSHDIFDRPEKPLRRCITVRSQKDKEVPLTHMMTALRAMDMQMADFTKWVEKNTGKGKGKKAKAISKPAPESETQKSK